MNSNIPSRMLRDAAISQDDGEDLAEFVIFLLDALEVPEVRSRVRDLLGIDTPLLPPRPVMPPSGRSPRGATRRR